MLRAQERLLVLTVLSKEARHGLVKRVVRRHHSMVIVDQRIVTIVCIAASDRDTARNKRGRSEVLGQPGDIVASRLRAARGDCVRRCIDETSLRHCASQSRKLSVMKFKRIHSALLAEPARG
jgi:hypothetical protein